MAKLLILRMNYKDGPTADRNYRGIMRKAYPNWNLPKYTTKESEILVEALSELTEARAPSYGDYETNYPIAQRIADIFTQYSEAGEQYEVIEFTYPFADPAYKSTFLGYDVVDGFDSEIILIFSDAHQNRLAPEDKALKRKYIDKLNKHLLFDRLEDAFRFYEEVQQAQIPGHYLKIIGIHTCVAQ